MVVKITDGISAITNRVVFQYKNRLRLGFNGYSQLLCYSFLFSYPSFSYAGPTGGNVVGGSGVINNTGLTTNINQLTSSLAIDWNSYNINSNEIVNYIQPGSNSIALNRILGNSASQIHGQINANGQVILVNPNGLFFSPTASINVGGLIASGLDIDPVDFMNGDYIFNEVLGTDGTVINSGIINASLGGNIALLGKQVINEGVISAQLGSVNLAAGKAAVLTFDNQGLLGVKITKEILQDEIGIDPAVINSGEINAESGRVLLTASVSQDIFSQAVNSGELQQATSVVVNEDGSFTLGAGADVLNTGTIDVSSTTDNVDAGQIVILGENITSSGAINADAINANAGEIELHSKNTTLLTENSATTASVENTGKGGVIKLLGDRVGLFDQSYVDASGASGGGEVLIGGDYRGLNTQIRNATATFLGVNTSVNADAIENGNGGRVIVWGNDSTKAYGAISARGGNQAGDGGFVETSAKVVDLKVAVDVRSPNGSGGTWLIDPLNISIENTNDSGITTDVSVTDETTFTANQTNSILDRDSVVGALTGGQTVIVETDVGGDPEIDPDLINPPGPGGNITINDTIDINGATGTNTLILNAHHDIVINSLIFDANGANDVLNLVFNADSNNADGGDVIINNNINTYGGSFTTSGNAFNLAAFRTIDTGDGDVNLNMDTTVTVAGIINAGVGSFGATGTTFNGTGSTITANSVNLNGMTGAITLGGMTASTITANSASSIVQSVADSGLNISGISTFDSSGLITLNDFDNDFGGAVRLSNSGANAVIVNDVDNIVLGTSSLGTGTLTVNAVGISQNDTITQAAGAGQATFNAGDGSINLTQANNFTGNIALNNTNTNNVQLTNSGAVQLATSNVGDGTLTVNASGGITQVGAITQEANAGATTLNVGAGFIVLGSANDFTGAVRVNNSGPNLVSITDTNDIELGTSNVGDGLYLINASSGITQSGAITQAAGANLAQFSAGNGEINLTQANDFTGSVNLINSGNNAVAINDQNALLLSTVSVGTSSLTVDAVGITQNGVITQAANAGTASFDANAGQLILTQANNFTGDVSLNNSGANNVAVTDTNAIQFTNSNIGSGTFTVNATGITQSGAITQEANAGATTINGGAAVIDLSQSNNFTGSVSLNNSGANAVAITDINSLLLGTSNIGTGTLTVDAVGINQDGAITQAAAAGLASFDANAGAINLTQANTFTGDVSLNNSGANNVSVVNSGAIQLATSNVGSGTLTMTANGFTQSGALTQAANAGAATFNAGTNIIALTQANEFTGAVSLNNSGLNAVSVTDQNNLILGTSNIGSSTFTLNSNGVSQTGALTQEAFALQSTINAGTGAIDLSQANDFTGSVMLTNSGANNVSIRDINALRFGLVNIGSGTFDINAVGISQSNTITQAAAAGAVTITGNAGSVSLTNSANDFTGTVSTTNSGNNAVFIYDSNGIDLGTTNVGGFYRAVAFNAGDITQSGALAVGGEAQFFADGGQSIVLANTSNNFQAGVSFFSLNATPLLNVGIANSGSLDLNTINVSNDLFVSAAGITDSGVLTVGNTAWLDAGANVINLDSANNFNNIVVSNASTASITDANAINIGTSDAPPGGVFTTTDSSITGALTITATGGITNTDASSLTVGGVTSLNAGANNILIDGNNNDFSVVNIINAQDVTLVDQNAIDLQSTAINGTLDVTAGADITNTAGALRVSGESTFITADNSSVLLTDAGNQLSGPVSINSAGPGTLLSAIITNSVLTDILSLNVATDLTFNTTAGITQSGIITAGNNTIINSANQDVTLGLANNLNNLTINAAKDVNINNGTNPLLVNGATTSGTLSLSSNGMTIAGSVTGATGVNLDSTTDTMQIDTDVQTNSGTLQIAGAQVNLNASLNSNNGDTNISSSQGIVMATNTSINAANGNIQLDAVDNINLTSLVATSGSASVNTTTGSINDVNADQLNFTANAVVMNAATGIGSGNSIETQTSSLDVVNNVSGEVQLNNTGEVNLIALKNLGSSGDITIENDGSYLINPGSVDAGYNTGALIMRSTGSYLGQGAQPPFTNADITARAGTFFGFAGTFGTTQRPLVLNIRDSALIQTRASLNPQFAEPRPIVNDESLLQFSGLDTLAAISGEQLVEVETLGEVDQAIFTDLQNFSMEEISIRMPRDQLFEDELEAYDR